MTQSSWADDIAKRVGEAIRQLREQADPKISAVELARRVEALGYPYSRNTLVNLELGRKRTVDVAELSAIAAALEVPPVLLLFPGIPNSTVEALPGLSLPSLEAVRWFSGERPIDRPIPSGRGRENRVNLLHLLRQEAAALRQLQRHLELPDAKPGIENEESWQRRKQNQEVHLRFLRDQQRLLGFTDTPLTELPADLKHIDDEPDGLDLIDGIEP